MLWWMFVAAFGQEVSGFAELRGAYQVGVDGLPVDGVARFRPTFSAPLSDAVSFVTTVQAELHGGRSLQREVQALFDNSVLREDGVLKEDESIWDMLHCDWPDENKPFGLADAGDMFAVERLYVDIYQDKYDLRIGRQAITWGSGQLINPTDPFPQVLFVSPWKFRQGINSAKLNVPLGSHEVVAMVGTSDSFNAVRAALRGTVNAAGTDFSATAAFRGETNETLLGVDMKGTLGVGWWIEAAYHIPQNDTPWEELVAGVDYSFPIFDRFVFGAQYYRNGSGSGEPGTAGAARRLTTDLELPNCNEDEDLSLASLLPFDPASASADVNPYAPFATGENYAMLMSNIQFNEYAATQFGAIQNLGDGTGILVPQVTIFPSGWSEISLIAQIPYKAWGSGGEFKPDPDTLVYSQRIDPNGQLPDTLDLDFNPLIPDVTFTLWTRATF